MPPVDNNPPRSRAGTVEPAKGAVPKVATAITAMTPMTLAPTAARPVVGVSRAFLREEADHNEQSVRRYFTKLMISGGQGQRLRGGRWELMPVEHFFLSLNTQIPIFNPERQPCSQVVSTVTAVFEGFIWD